MHYDDWTLVAATAWLVGLASLLCDHFQPHWPFIVGMHALFGLATCVAICLVLFAKARALAGAPNAELYLFCRLVSRWVYVLMYALAMIRVGLYVDEAMQHSLLHGGRHNTTPVRSIDDFQFYVACCVLPLWAARAVILAVPLKRRATPHASISRLQA